MTLNSNSIVESLALPETPATDNPLLKRFINLPVASLLTLEGSDAALPSAEEQERHRIYAGALSALVLHYWNGNKNGRGGTYPLNTPVDTPSAKHLSGDYLGHNIAGLAVDRLGHIIDFDFNHNKLFNSSAEHAEARLVRRVFSLAQIADTWGLSAEAPLTPATDYTTLSDVTVYTSLESCAQCSGVMALGRVKAVVYLQTDPGTYLIGRILRNLTDQQLRAPLPIPASLVSFGQFEQLDAAYRTFFNRSPNEPFHIDPAGKKDQTQSITSFLCTDAARTIFASASQDFTALGSTRPLTAPLYRPGPAALSNIDVLDEARQFLRYATDVARRGTPHH